MRALCLISLLVCTGCQGIMHEIKPHRLWRWNYYEPTSRNAFGTFSIDDPLQTELTPVMKREAAQTFQKVEAPMPMVK